MTTVMPVPRVTATRATRLVDEFRSLPIEVVRARMIEASSLPATELTRRLAASDRANATAAATALSQA